MRSTLHGPEAFLLKSKKPHIQALVAACPNMTVEAIEMLNEKSDIIRGLLNIKQQQSHAESASRAALLADMMIKKHHPELL
jgi:hypothetical protein